MGITKIYKDNPPIVFYSNQDRPRFSKDVLEEEIQIMVINPKKQFLTNHQLKFALSHQCFQSTNLRTAAWPLLILIVNY